MDVEVFIRYRYNRLTTLNGESMTPSPAKQEYLRQHRRETFLYLIVPLFVTVFTSFNVGVSSVLLMVHVSAMPSGTEIVEPDCVPPSQLHEPAV